MIELHEEQPEICFNDFINAIENKHVLWMAETELRQALKTQDFQYIGWLAYECAKTWLRENKEK